MTGSMGTSLTPGGASTPEQSTKKLILNGHAASKISTSYNDKDTDGLATSYALFQGLQTLRGLIDSKLNEAGVTARSVFSDNLVSDHFTPVLADPNLGWILEGWQSSGGHAIYQEHGDVYTTTNRLAIPRGRYESAGHHLMVLAVSEISGTLHVCKNDQIVLTITEPGTYTVTFTIENTVVDTVYLRGTSVAVGSQIALTDIYCVHLIDELADYVHHVVQKILAGMGDYKFVTLEELNESLDSVVSQLTTKLLEHSSARNPHGTTAADVGAAAEQHVHAEYATQDELLRRTAATLSDAATIMAAPQAAVPEAMVGPLFIRPTAILKTMYLNHVSSSRYDPYAGIISATMPTDGLLSRAVDAGTDTHDRYATFTQYQGDMLVRYEFAQPRPVKTILLNTVATEQAGRVSELSIFIGGQRFDQVLVNGLNAVDVNTATVSSIVIMVTGVADTSKTKFNLGFDVLFSDLQEELGVTAGTKFAIHTSSGTEVHTIETDAQIPAGYLLVGPEYTVSAIVDGEDISYELVPYRHQFVYGKAQNYPLTNMEGNLSQYWGSVSIQGVAGPENAYRIYQTRDALVPTSNVVVVDHVFPVSMQLEDVRVHLKTALANGYAHPTTIQVSMTLVDDTVVERSIDVPATAVNSLGTHTIIRVPVAIQSNQNVRSLQITCTAPDGTLCQVSQVQVGIQLPYYDIQSRMWSDGKLRQVLGTVKVLPSNRLQVTSMPLGKLASLPVNDLEKTAFSSIYTLKNPFHTNYITHLYATYLGVEGTFNLQGVDAEKIILYSVSETQGYITVARTW